MIEKDAEDKLCDRKSEREMIQETGNEMKLYVDLGVKGKREKAMLLRWQVKGKRYYSFGLNQNRLSLLRYQIHYSKPCVLEEKLWHNRGPYKF